MRSDSALGEKVAVHLRAEAGVQAVLASLPHVPPAAWTLTGCSTWRPGSVPVNFSVLPLIVLVLEEAHPLRQLISLRGTAGACWVGDGVDKALVDLVEERRKDGPGRPQLVPARTSQASQLKTNPEIGKILSKYRKYYYYFKKKKKKHTHV